MDFLHPAHIRFLSEERWKLAVGYNLRTSDAMSGCFELGLLPHKGFNITGCWLILDGCAAGQAKNDKVFYNEKEICADDE
ncbi:MAG TPA: hypothetical protein ENN39_12345 [Desulfonatronum sp.]|nr:hypothetical protein [Desulfonatronum sp.]